LELIKEDLYLDIDINWLFFHPSYELTSATMFRCFIDASLYFL